MSKQFIFTEYWVTCVWCDCEVPLSDAYDDDTCDYRECRLKTELAHQDLVRWK